MKKQPLKKGDLVTVGAPNSFYYQFLREMPKGYLGLRCKTCEVIASSSGSFDCGIIQTYPLRIVKLKQTREPKPR